MAAQDKKYQYPVPNSADSNPNRTDAPNIMGIFQIRLMTCLFRVVENKQCKTCGG